MNIFHAEHLVRFLSDHPLYMNEYKNLKHEEMRNNIGKTLLHSSVKIKPQAIQISHRFEIKTKTQRRA